MMSILRYHLLVVFAAVCAQAPAGTIINGDFSSKTDLEGFAVTGTGITEPTGEFAQITANGTAMQTLEQTFDIPIGPSRLSFDFAFSTTATLPTSLAFLDSFAVSLITETDGDFVDLLVVDLMGIIPDPSDGILGSVPISIDPVFPVKMDGFEEFATGTSYSGRISLLLPSAVLGERATLYFDLNDSNFISGNVQTIAGIDNISLTTTGAVVPEPASLALWVGMLVCGACSGTLFRRRRHAVYA